MKECFAEVKCVFRAPAGNHDVTACLTSSRIFSKTGRCGVGWSFGQLQNPLCCDTHAIETRKLSVFVEQHSVMGAPCEIDIFSHALLHLMTRQLECPLGIIHLNAGQLLSCMHFGSSKIISKENAKEAPIPPARSIVEKF